MKTLTTKLTRSIPIALKVFGAVLFCVSSLQAITPYEGNFVSVANSNGTLVALNPSGSIYSSSDGGMNFILRQANSEIYSVIESSGNTVIAVGIDGLVQRSTNQGSSWATIDPQDNAILGSLLGLAPKPNTAHWVAVGVDGFNGAIFKSIDNGIQWSKQTLSNVELKDVVWSGSRWVACGFDLFNTAVVYQSTTGNSWTAVTLPSGTKPLLALATNGSGRVVAVGEGGSVLISTDGGLTFGTLTGGISVTNDLNAAYYNAADQSFVIGGEELVVLSVNGSTVNLVTEPIAGAVSIRDFESIGGSLVAFGKFEDDLVRLSDLSFSLKIQGDGSLLLRLSNTLIGRSYVLQSSSDLQTWADVPNSTLAGNGSSLDWELSVPTVDSFWRVREF